jgi:BirA family biotin operon repressor/biotin-[acetyl-CoA-carboxylase] ligase
MAYTFASLLLKEGLHPKIKWPNDILLNGKKLSGVLCETTYYPLKRQVSHADAMMLFCP